METFYMKLFFMSKQTLDHLKLVSFVSFPDSILPALEESELKCLTATNGHRCRRRSLPKQAHGDGIRSGGSQWVCH
jgi:hypothetical protein